MFFDGEEAFVNWSENDSIYGSRYYSKMLKSMYGSDAFDSMDLFVLLDLIGAETSKFPNYFPFATGSAYSVLSKIGKY